jgi:ATP-dependent DNA helicase RecG
LRRNPRRRALDAKTPNIGYNQVAEQLNFDLTIPLEKDIRLLSVAEVYSVLDRISPVDLREDRRFERKPAGIQARALSDYFSIFANTAPEGGIILVGIEDNGTITGCRRAEITHMNHLERAGDVYCPDARYEYKNVRVVNADGHEDFILAIWVKYREDKLVETTDGVVYIRRGSSRRKLKPDEVRELQNAKGQVEVEREPVALRFPEDFKQPVITQFASTVREMRRLPERLRADEILELRHLGKITAGKFVPNLACALMFAKDPQTVVPGCRVRFFRYNGTVEKTGADYNVIKDIPIDGGVPELIQATAEVIEAQVRDFVHLGKDQRFYSMPEYPREAWYEALVNACVHRSYSLGNMNIFIKMFDDRLVIESPGGFPPFVTPENIYDMHQPRNPYLMDAMFYMRFVQAAHEGTRRMRDAMKAMGLPEPIFAQKEIGTALVQVVLKNDVEHRKEFVDTDAFLALGPRIARSLNEYERRIINFVIENRTINVTQASGLINRRWHFTKKTLTNLIDRGILDRVHSEKIERDSYAYYTLPKRLSDRIARSEP